MSLTEEERDKVAGGGMKRVDTPYITTFSSVPKENAQSTDNPWVDKQPDELMNK